MANFITRISVYKTRDSWKLTRTLVRENSRKTREGIYEREMEYSARTFLDGYCVVDFATE
jgi:hypothetical protein